MIVSVVGLHRHIAGLELGVGFGRNRWLSWMARRRGWRFGRLDLEFAGSLAAIWGWTREVLGMTLVAISSHCFNSGNVSVVFIARAVSSYSHIENIILNSMNRGLSKSTSLGP